MTFLQLANSLFAAAVFASVACRLAKLHGHTPDGSSRVRWHAWVLAHALIALGAFAVMLGPLYGYRTPHLAEVCINAGLAMYFGIRWRRRSSEQ